MESATDNGKNISELKEKRCEISPYSKLQSKDKSLSDSDDAVTSSRSRHHHQHQQQQQQWIHDGMTPSPQDQPQRPSTADERIDVTNSNAQVCKEHLSVTSPDGALTSASQEISDGTVTSAQDDETQSATAIASVASMLPCTYGLICLVSGPLISLTGSSATPMYTSTIFFALGGLTVFSFSLTDHQITLNNIN
jgi:hypothetical protein